MAGCEIVGAVEIDEWAAETFSFNHPTAKVLNADIQALSDDQIRNAFVPLRPDVLLGGPPCQGFSVCVKNAGDPSDPRNSLFVEFLRVARLLHPQLVILENVPNIEKARTSGNEMVLDIIKRQLQELGYCVKHRVLEAVDYGIPQIRKRLFVVASKEIIDNPFPAPTHSLTTNINELGLFGPTGLPCPCPNLWDAISDLTPLRAGEGEEIQEYHSPPLTGYQAVLRQGSRRLFNHTAMRHSKRMVERFSAMSCGQSQSDVPRNLRPLKRNGDGVISDKTYDQNNRRMYPDKPCHTVPASFYANFVHPYQHRNFTPREGARIQSFPDRFVFKGKPTVVSHKLLAREGRSDEKHLCQYNQIGNAVPPLMAKALATHIQKLKIRNCTSNKEQDACSR